MLLIFSDIFIHLVSSKLKNILHRQYKPIIETVRSHVRGLALRYVHYISTRGSTSPPEPFCHCSIFFNRRQDKCGYSFHVFQMASHIHVLIQSSQISVARHSPLTPRAEQQQFRTIYKLCTTVGTNTAAGRTLCQTDL